MTSCGTFQKLRPLSLLTHLSNCYDSAHLQVSSNSVSWSIYLEQGKIIYASHSVDPFDRLDCHLRRLGHKIPTLVSETRAQLRLLFETDPDSQLTQNSDYQAICWLVNQQYLNSEQAAVLIEQIVIEVIESFLLVKEGSYELRGKFNLTTDFCKLDLQPIVEHCQKRLQAWQSLAPQISSPYQRPYFINRDKNQYRLSLEIEQKLSAIVKGFSFRHLAILLNQDELQLAQSLHPYVLAGTILLHEPHPPFEQLPKIEQPQNSRNLDTSTTKLEKKQVNQVKNTSNNLEVSNSWQTHSTQLPKLPNRPSELVEKKVILDASNTENSSKTPRGKLQNYPSIKNTYKIVCVDDSPAILNEISYFLDDESFTVFPINDPVKALMQIMRIKPDLILLDVRMSGINGYELCRLIRNHSLFKNTPIIMVTGNTGIVDRVKARLVGASGYLTKPFTQPELLKIVFRHLF